jgi:hypothetical protein
VDKTASLLTEYNQEHGGEGMRGEAGSILLGDGSHGERGWVAMTCYEFIVFSTRSPNAFSQGVEAWATIRVKVLRSVPMTVAPSGASVPEWRLYFGAAWQWRGMP